MSGIDDGANPPPDPGHGAIRRLLSFYQIAGRSVDWFETTALCLGVSLLTLVVVANVFARIFAQSIYFVEELSEFLIIFITFVGLGYAARRARHIRMGAFLDLLPRVIEKILIFIIATFSALVMFTMAIHAWNYMQEVRVMEQTTSALRVPYWTFLVIVPVGFGAAGIQYVRTVIKNIRAKEVWLSSEQQSEYEELPRESKPT